MPAVFVLDWEKLQEAGESFQVIEEQLRALFEVN